MKKVLSLLLVFVMLFSIVGCGKEEPDDNSTTTTTEAVNNDVESSTSETTTKQTQKPTETTTKKSSDETTTKKTGSTPVTIQKKILVMVRLYSIHQILKKQILHTLLSLLLTAQDFLMTFMKTCLLSLQRANTLLLLTQKLCQVMVLHSLHLWIS